MILLLSALNRLQTTSRDPLNFPTSIFKYGLSDCIILFCSVMTKKQDCFKTILLFFIARQRRQILPQSPDNHGRDRFPSSSCLRPGFHEAILFISAVAVWPRTALSLANRFFEASGFYKSSIQPVLFEFTVFSITEFLSMRAI